MTQAWRQPGSSFKPFIYSAALDKGVTAASVINDAPITISAAETGSGSRWEPHNFDGKFEGPMRMRIALTKSKNMVSIRILQHIGVAYAQDYIQRFGFFTQDASGIPDHGIGRRIGDFLADAGRIFRVCQWWIPRTALSDLQH